MQKDPNHISTRELLPLRFVNKHWFFEYNIRLTRDPARTLSTALELEDDEITLEVINYLKDHIFTLIEERHIMRAYLDSFSGKRVKSELGKLKTVDRDGNVTTFDTGPSYLDKNYPYKNQKSMFGTIRDKFKNLL